MGISEIIIIISASLIVAAVAVVAIRRKLTGGRSCGCGGCSGDCKGCGGACDAGKKHGKTENNNIKEDKNSAS